MKPPNTMKKLIFLSLIILTFTQCAPQMTAEWSKTGYVKSPAKSILVLAMVKTLEGRQSLENFIIEDLKKNHSNYKFVRGLDVFPPNQAKYSEEEALEKIKSLNVDLILTTAFVKAYTSQVYVPGDNVYVPYYYNVGRQIYSTYDIMSTPGYYENMDNFVLVSNLYDLREGNDEKKAMIWQGQSEVMAPSSITSGASDYADNLVKYLDKNNILP